MNNDPDTTPTETPEQAALAAMDQGIEAAPSDPTPEPPAVVDQPAAPAPAEGEPAADPVDPNAPPAEPVDPNAPPPDPAAPPVAPKPEGDGEPDPDAEARDQAKKLGLSGKASERFVAMAQEIKTLAPIKELLEKAGIKDVATELPKVMEKAQAADDIIGMVMDTGATSDQYGATLDYLKLVNSGDPALMSQAFDKLLGELQDLGKLVGREVPGAYDPLQDHADLKAEVEGGDMPRARALELVAKRNAEKLTEARRNEQATAAQSTQAMEQGRATLNQLGAELAAADPDYARKQPFLLPMLRLITQTKPPAEWAGAARAAYAALPAMPAPAAPKPVPGPMRPGGNIPPVAPVTDDPFKAMDYGIAMASG